MRYITSALRQGIADMVTRASLQPGSRVLDFGCANRPYADLIRVTSEYVGADLSGNDKADVTIGHDGTVPLPDGSFDMVLSTQVLEHAHDPGLYLRECLRLLRPGGRLVLSTHGIMVWHPDPNDLWRWTCEGLRLEVERAGFEVEHFSGVMGLASTGLQLIQYAVLRRLPRLRRLWCATMQFLVRHADRWIDGNARDRDALVFIVCARRPPEP